MLPGVIGLLQATEVVKLLLGKGTPLVGRLLAFDALQTKFREFKVGVDPACAHAGAAPAAQACAAPAAGAC